MNIRLLFLTVAGALALAACGNKGPLVKASKPDPEAETPAVDTPKGDVPVEIIDDTGGGANPPSDATGDDTHTPTDAAGDDTGAETLPTTGG